MPECLQSLKQFHFNDAEERELAAYAKAIGHPASSDLVSQIGLAQSTVSEHLRVLKEAGLVHAEVQHPRTCFSLRPEALDRLQTLLMGISAG